MSEQAKYEHVWSINSYREACHSLALYEAHPEIFPPFETALDIGCGTGRFFAYLVDHGKGAAGVDIAGNCLDPDVKRRHGHRFSRQALWEMTFATFYDLGVCCDVMEHIPPDYVDTTLKQISAYCRTTIFGIAQFPSQVGEHQLHLTVEDKDWWFAKISALGGLVTPLEVDMKRVGPVHYFKWEC